jgi:FKBP-type peptidyl-prolyl cis-trans isomerase FkpA
MNRVFLALALVAAAAGCSSTPSAPTTTSSPYSQTDLTVGTGATAATGNTVTVAYTGWLYESSKTAGKGAQFDTNTSFPFPLGSGQVIKGWDRGIPGMRVGGRRRLVIPPDLAYGSNGSGTAIPPNATLLFDITLNAVE